MEEEADAAKGKERRVTFRMEGGDYDALCERAGFSKSEYLRYLVRIPLSTEANAGEEHRILVDRRVLWAMSRELTKWGYHYNQAVHAMNLINFHARHGHVDRDLVAESIPTIEHEIAIVYHGDNARGIPHAHIVVNNANLRTGYCMQTQHPEDLNRDLQDMACERGLSGLSNDRAPSSSTTSRS